MYSGSDTPAHEKLRTDFHHLYDVYFTDNVDKSIAPHYISWSEMVDELSKIKLGKSSSGDIKPEHILLGSTKLALHIHLLFNSMIQHGVVVSDFLKGTITPIVKDHQGDF